MKTSIKWTLLLLIVMTLSTSCKVTVDAVDWNSDMPAAYGVRSDTGNVAFVPWRIFFTDTLLTRLLTLAAANNLETRIAVERAHLANATYAVAKSRMLPSINASASARADRFGDYTMNGIGNHDTNRSETLPADQILPNPYPEYFLGFTFSWEANLWNKLGSMRKAAEARFMASKEMRHVVVSRLVGEVATEYYELLGLDQEKKVLVENLNLQGLAVELVKIQKAGGKVNQLAVDQFESQYLNTRNRLFRVEQYIVETEARINQLAGRFPGLMMRDSIRGYDSTLNINIGSPHDLIGQRPDIRKAELEVMAAHADVYAARAAFYPSLHFSGSAGFSAFDFSKLFLTPASAVYSLGAGLAAPIIQQRRIKALFAAANARQRIALIDFHKAVLDGFHEVYRTINDFHTLRRQIKVKTEEVQVLKRATLNANDLFSVGFATYLEVITAQQRLLEGEMELAELNKRLLQGRALLYRALGGGWEST